MEFPQYISVPQRTTSVVGYVDKGNEGKDTTKFVDGKGYIDEDQFIWIYSGGGEPKNKNQYPYFWLEDGVKKFSDPPKLIKTAYSVDNIKDMGIATIINNTEPNKPLFDEKEIADMNAASATYTPIFYASDDFLKKLVKYTILVKGIDINRLKNKTGEKYILNNMKQALSNKTKMSVMYFYQWMNLLGCEFEMTILDSGEDTIDPLKNPLIYQSNKDRVCTIVNGELIDVLGVTEEEREEDE